MKMLIKLFLVIAIIMYFLSLIYTNEIFNFLANKNKLNPNQLMYINGRAYAIFNLSGKNGVGLVDTGATQSNFDIKKYDSSVVTRIGKQDVNTPLGRINAQTYKIENMYFMGRHIAKSVVFKTGFMQSNTIGCPEIFNSPEVLITKNGIYYDKHIEEFKDAIEIPVTYSRSNEKPFKIKSIIYSLEIDGKIEQAILDTGISAYLTGTTISEKNNFNWSVSVFNSSSGFAFKKVYASSATLKIGQEEIKINYKSIPGWNAPRAKFYLGAEILQHYSLFFNFNKNKFYFIKNETKKI